MADVNLLVRCFVGVMITVLMAWAGKDGQGSFCSAKFIRKMHAKKKKKSYKVGLQFTCIIGRLISD